METPELDIRLGAPVLAADGRRVGAVDQVVLEPSSRRVVDVVVRRGVLLTRDVVVPVASIAEASAEAVRLRLRTDQLSTLSDFEEAAYLPLESQDVPPLITWEGPPDYEPRPILVPAASLYSPPIKPFAPQLVEEWENVPADAAGLAPGAPVACTDGLVGTIGEVRVDPVDGHLVAVAVEGADRRWVIPADEVEVTDVGGILLRLRQCDLEPYAQAA
jgi:sporulation protein YlmC with PRC-barrel domain